MMIYSKKNNNNPILKKEIYPAENPKINENSEQIKTEKKKVNSFLILIATLLFIIPLSFFIKQNRLINNILSLSQDKNLAQVSQQEWREITDSLANGYLYNSFRQKLKKNFQINSNSSNSNNKFFKNLHQLTYIPQGNNGGVLGANTENQMASNSASKKNLAFYLNKLRVSGQFNNVQTNSKENYEFFITSVISDDIAGGGIGDFAINGKIANLELGNPDTDALHLSVVEPDRNKVYLKASISDIFLISLDRLIYPDETKAEKNSIISANYDDIYPYFDKYVELELTHENSDPLPAEIEKFMKDASSFSDITFNSTLGNIDTYLDIATTQKDTVAGENIIRVKTKVKSIALFEQLGNYLNKTNQFIRDNKSTYDPYCQKQEDYHTCLNNFGYVDEEKPNFDLRLIAPLVNFDKFDLILSRVENEILGVDLEISLNETALDLIKKSDMPELAILENLQDLRVEFAYSELEKKEVSKIFKPTSYIKILEDNTYREFNAAADRNNNEGTDILAEKLASMNKLYVNEVWETDLEKLSKNKKNYCQDGWKPAFCLTVGEDWRQTHEASESSNFLSFSYPAKYYSFNQPHILLTIKKLTEEPIVTRCNKEDYEDFVEFITVDGLVFRLNKYLDTEFAYENELLAQVCYQNKLDEYINRSLLADSIHVHAQGFTFDELAQKVVPILETMTANDLDEIDLSKDLGESLENQETYYFDKDNYNQNSCEIGFYRDENGKSQYYEDIKKDLQIEREFNILIVNEDTALCQNGMCLKCIAGEMKYQDLEICKGLSCNP